MYDCLPMYHTAGGVVATGAVLVAGGSVVIREKFSAREFWDDIVRQRLHPVSIYRRVVPLSRRTRRRIRSERGHRLRLACGNGLRPDVWPRFQARFAIPKILEFYAATEGNVNLFNFEGRPGAVGRVPWFLARRFRPRSSGSTSRSKRRSAMRAGSAIECARRAKSAKRSARSSTTPEAQHAVRGLCRRGGETRRKSCATCSRTATPGSAPAT